MRNAGTVVLVLTLCVSCGGQPTESSSSETSSGGEGATSTDGDVVVYETGVSPDARAAMEAEPDGAMMEGGAAAASDVPLRITFLDTGQGDCAILECSNGSNIMIDCGKTAWGNSSLDHVRTSFDAIIGPNEAIDVLVLTHPDQDHYNLIADVVGDHPIRRAIHSLSLDDYDVGGFNEWLPAHADEIVALDGEVHEDAPSNLFDCGDADIQILAANVPSTNSAASWRTNGASIVLRIYHGNFTAILTGDATFDTENAILAHYGSSTLDIDLLRLGHHGTSVTSSAQDWLNALSPETTVVSAGHHGSFRHPRCPVLDRAMDLVSTVPGTSEACHVVTCGIGSGETGLDGCGSGDWCEVETTEPVYDTYSSGDLTFESRFVDWSLISTERGRCE